MRVPELDSLCEGRGGTAGDDIVVEVAGASRGEVEVGAGA